MFYKGDDMKVCVGFDLTDQKVGKEAVAGFSNFWVDPKENGIGRKALAMAEAIAGSKILVGFASVSNVGFYRSCDWFIGPSFEDSVFGSKYLVASEPIDLENFDGNIW